MSIYQDTTELKRLFEQDIFKPASPEDIENRRNEIIQKHKMLQELCPHCGKNLADDDVGVSMSETQYSTVHIYWNTTVGEWEYGDPDHGDSEVNSYLCGACGEEISRYKDFDKENSR